MTEELTRVDSAVAGLSISPKDEKTQTKADEKEKKKHKRVGSTVDGVRNINDLGMLRPLCCHCLISLMYGLEKEQIPIEIAIETQKLGWYDTVPVFVCTSLCLQLTDY